MEYLHGGQHERARRLLNEAPTLAETLPLRFAEGAAVHDPSFHCAQCRHHFSPEQIHVWIHHPVKGMVALEMVGHCKQCHIMTVCWMRAYKDGRLLVYNGQKGYWRESRPSRNGQKGRRQGQPQQSHPRGSFPPWWDLVGWIRWIRAKIRW